MKKPTPTPDCNICHKSGYVIVKKENGERVARQCSCREPVPNQGQLRQEDFNSFVDGVVKDF